MCELLPYNWRFRATEQMMLPEKWLYSEKRKECLGPGSGESQNTEVG